MPVAKLLLCFILAWSIIASTRINLYLTDELHDDEEDDDAPAYHCLRIAAHATHHRDPHQILSFCLTTSPLSHTSIEETFDPKFTFDQLSNLNVTGEDLYLWSAPIDLIEQYQFYLNQQSTSDTLEAPRQPFYNCTTPDFGPLCQYSFDLSSIDDASLNQISYAFYQKQYKPSRLTCYTHLVCNRGSSEACLHWTEICDGYVDCLNDAVDEKYCWPLETSECTADEYRCDNGQCIAKVFLHDDPNAFECLDQSDVRRDVVNVPPFSNNEPTISNDDLTCNQRFHTIGVRLSSSCVEERDPLLQNALLTETPRGLSERCWLVFRCYSLILPAADQRCSKECPFIKCKQILNETCPNEFLIPAQPLAFGHLHLILMKSVVLSHVLWQPPAYICYDPQLCNGSSSNGTPLSINNMTCRPPGDFPVTFKIMGRPGWREFYLKPLYEQLRKCSMIPYNEPINCDQSNMYQCRNSDKCLSIYRRCDGIVDCDQRDDEECTSIISGNCSTLRPDLLFQCTSTNQCISVKRVNNRVCDCGTDVFGLCDDETGEIDLIRKRISFPTICDGFKELKPLIIDGRNESDETECQHWQCNNTYTRCDGIWNCLNGADEVNCDRSMLLQCPFDHHVCVSPTTYQLICLPISKANDGHIDCLGATDEQPLCRLYSSTGELSGKNFHCQNDTHHLCTSSTQLCGSKATCPHRDDQLFCTPNTNRTSSQSLCSLSQAWSRSNVENFFCRLVPDNKKPQKVHFSFAGTKGSPPTTQTSTPSSSIATIIDRSQQRCHRGLPLRARSVKNPNTSTSACLCPSSYYGSECQYENERVSLTLRMQAYSDSQRTLFALLVYLIDYSEQQVIHSYEKVTYLYVEHCQTKFNVQLLYSTRPKQPGRNYSIHVDIYEKIALIYRGSLFVDVKYSFLPVNRLAVQLNIPQTNKIPDLCSDLPCLRGRCIRYSNGPEPRRGFCQCHEGWFGKHCQIEHRCSCVEGSLCVGVSTHNRSVCVCPLHRWGPRCLLFSTICDRLNQNQTCLNAGRCVPMDELMIEDKAFLCLCQPGYSGSRCELMDQKIQVTFDEKIVLPSSILVHFIRVIDDGSPENGSTFKTIPTSQRSVIIRWSRPFHILFLELFTHQYYLITVQQIYNRSIHISRNLHPSDRCPHLSDILNETIANYHLLRRVKYYHLACQQSSPQASCFYDQNHFCFCHDFAHQRLANCFEFNPSIKHDCFGQSNCEHGAQCLQDRAECPQTSICVCPECFYGTRCQFSSSLFGLSLDGILGPYIQPKITLSEQSSVVIISVALTVSMLVAGLINGVMSLVTFLNAEPRKVGCGIYLFSSSLTTLFTMIILAMKVSILLVAQMNNMNQRSFLQFQCISIDFLLRIGLNMDQWLNACVAMERSVATIQGVKFNKTKSKQLAKYIVVLLLVLNIATTLQDPIHRHLFDDDDDEDSEGNGNHRIWCIVRYPSRVRTFNSVINLLHFIVPFGINIISALIIILLTARQRATARSNQTPQQLLRSQLQQHKHLLIAPVILVVLALPRLILSFVSGCMKSARSPWLFFSGYFVSFVPPMLTFVIFVLPSKLYKREFHQSVRRYRQAVRTRLYLAS